MIFYKMKANKLIPSTSLVSEIIMCFHKDVNTFQDMW
jgi:hypothetical protein